ncbi:TPA: hypothetical protein P0O07_001324 [Yersinia enterocolitica]|nr:hypothetical protein [Yersinia enterocolitica]
MLSNSTFTGYWLNTTDANTANPENTDGSLTGWVPAFAYGTTAITGLAAANVTLTALQAANERITLAGVLTANINLIFPAWRKSWTIINNCTGSFSVNCKTPSGTGIAVAAGATSRIIGDGTNIISNESPLITGALQKANNLSEIAASGSAAQAVAQANIGVTGGLGASVIGRLIAKRSITSTGVIPKATGAKWAIIRAWSAGGGGGGAGRTVTAGNASQGWAGQSGSFIEVLVDVSGLSNYDCSIGLGGTGGAASNVNAGNPGLDGGSTIIAGILSCPGGKGGQPGVLGTTNNTGIAIVGTALPTATLGTILDSSVSDIGAPGSQVGTGPNQSLGCRGGSAPGGLGSVGGQAGRPIDAGTDGTGGDGKGHAAGGGGGSSVSNTTGYGGGNGTGGFISITEFA